MAYMEWDDAFSIGIAEIDSQHMRIIGLINELYEGLKEGESHSLLEQLFNELLEHSLVHFKTEEDLFARYKYPLILEHTVEHKRFGVIVLQFHQDFIDRRINSPLQILDFLSMWLRDHILGKDQQYAAFLTGKMG